MWYAAQGGKYFSWDVFFSERKWSEKLLKSLLQCCLHDGGLEQLGEPLLGVPPRHLELLLYKLPAVVHPGSISIHLKVLLSFKDGWMDGLSRVNLWSRSTLTAWLDLSDWVQSRCQHSPIILAPDLFVGFFFYFAKSATISNFNTFSLGGVQLFYLQVTGSWWNSTIWKRNLKSSLLFRII